jgi:hypothetical protein
VGHLPTAARFRHPLPTAQLTTTLVYPQVSPSSNSVHTMDHLLDLEWTVVDEVDVAHAGMDSPDPSPAAQPSVPRPATPTGEPPSGSPHEKPQRTTASSHNTAEDTAPARTPAPAQIAKDMPEDVCDGVEYEEWVEDNPYGRGPPGNTTSPARGFVLEVRRPRPLPQPQKGTGARGIPRPTRTASNPVTSLPQVIVTTAEMRTCRNVTKN